MTLHTSADAPITCAYWDELCDEDGFLALGRNRYTCDYFIYTDGTYYYAENGTTGNLDYGGPNNLGGVTGTNFRDVFQAVLTNLDAGKIGIGVGTFEWDDDILIDDRKTIVGAGKDSTVLRRSVVNKTITLQSGVAWTESIHLMDMTIHGNNLAGTLVSVNSGRSVTLDRVRITSSTGVGLHVPFGSWATVINRCWFDQCDVGALLEANFVQMVNSVSRYNITTNVRITSAGSAVRLIDSVIEKATAAGSYNLEIQGGASEIIAGHVIRGCWLEDAAAGGGNIKIFNRTVADICGVKIMLCEFSEDETSIWIEEATDTKIIANHFGGVGTGINIRASASTTLIQDNELDSTTPFTNAGTGTLILYNPGYNPVAASTPAVGASPVTYGPYTYPMYIEVSGGTVTSVTVRTVASGLLSGGWMLYPGDTCVIVYAVVPVVKLWPQ